MLFWCLSIKQWCSAFCNAVPEKIKHFHQVTRRWKGDFHVLGCWGLDTASKLELSMFTLEESEGISPFNPFWTTVKLAKEKSTFFSRKVLELSVWVAGPEVSSPNVCYFCLAVVFFSCNLSLSVNCTSSWLTFWAVCLFFLTIHAVAL